MVGLTHLRTSFCLVALLEPPMLHEILWNILGPQNILQFAAHPNMYKHARTMALPNWAGIGQDGLPDWTGIGQDGYSQTLFC